MKNKTTNIIVGAVFIIAGIIFGGNALNFWDIDFFFDGWWTIFIILPCIISMVNDGVNVGNVIGLLVGIALLLSAQDIISFHYFWKLIVPVILVVIGVKIVFGTNNKNGFNAEIKNVDDGKKAEYVSVFSHQNVDYTDKEFKGAEAVSVFGGMTLNLKYAHLSSDEYIEATSVFGGMDIFVPADVNVKVNSTNIFGSTHNNINKTEDMSMRTIYINATSIFGGVHIK